MEGWEAAQLDHQKGMKYREIADKYGVSVSAVKSWAARYWKKKVAQKVATKKGKKLQPSDATLQPKNPKSGGQPGNQNAIGNAGGGAPKGNTNNLRHGFYWDTLTDEERQMLDKREMLTEEDRLQNELTLWEVRERRLMQEIAQQRAIASGLAVQSVKKTGNETTTIAISTRENIHRMNVLLNTAQRSHLRCIEALENIKNRQSLKPPDTSERVDMSGLSEDDLRALAREAAKVSEQ